MVKTIEWKNNTIKMLDQTLLPGRVVYRTYRDYRAVADAITRLVVRGAPAIGVAAAMGVALGAIKIKTKDITKFKKELKKVTKKLAASRPTAVNLFWAINRMETLVEESTTTSVEALQRKLVAEGKRVLREDIAINKLIGKHGGKRIKNNWTVLTHCNAGSLATGGYGTALGVIRGAKAAGKKIKVFADETRPVLQGSRLTAWELMEDKIDVTLITDNMAGALMAQGLIDCVVVGADRIAANGDVANKIGTYTVAVLARAHGIPFYVAAPLSTIDTDIKSGVEIPIEERASTEVTHVQGKRIAPLKCKVRNPAFDVTPSMLVTGIVTEKGVIKAPYKAAIKKLFK
jgi:methylthioribose-1-phosphate isomerase